MLLFPPIRQKGDWIEASGFSNTASDWEKDVLNANNLGALNYFGLMPNYRWMAYRTTTDFYKNQEIVKSGGKPYKLVSITKSVAWPLFTIQIAIYFLILARSNNDLFWKFIRFNKNIFWP